MSKHIYNLYSVINAINDIDMAKRLTDTEKYKKQFFRSLKAPYKLLWDYILCDCNHAGIWIVDFEAARMYLGKDIRITEKAALEAFNKDELHVLPIDCGEKWFIVGFVEYQYGTLNPRNRVHASVIKILERYGLWRDGKLTIDTKTVPQRKLPAQQQGTNQNEQLGDELADKMTEAPLKGYERFSFSFVADEYREIFFTWLEYKRDRKQRYKNQYSLELAYKKMLNLGKNDVATVRQVVEQSIANNWAGLFGLRESKSYPISTNHTNDKVDKNYTPWPKR